MSVSQSTRSPLSCLALFMTCLAILGSILAAAHYLVIDLPAQKNLPAPENAISSTSNCEVCKHNCKIDKDYFYCLAICEDIVCSGNV